MNQSQMQSANAIWIVFYSDFFFGFMFTNPMGNSSVCTYAKLMVGDVLNTRNGGQVMFNPVTKNGWTFPFKLSNGCLFCLLDVGPRSFQLMRESRRHRFTINTPTNNTNKNSKAAKSQHHVAIWYNSQTTTTSNNMLNSDVARSHDSDFRIKATIQTQTPQSTTDNNNNNNYPSRQNNNNQYKYQQNYPTIVICGFFRRFQININGQIMVTTMLLMYGNVSNTNVIKKPSVTLAMTWLRMLTLNERTMIVIGTPLNNAPDDSYCMTVIQSWLIHVVRIICLVVQMVFIVVFLHQMVGMIMVHLVHIVIGKVLMISIVLIQFLDCTL